MIDVKSEVGKPSYSTVQEDLGQSTCCSWVLTLAEMCTLLTVV